MFNCNHQKHDYIYQGGYIDLHLPSTGFAIQCTAVTYTVTANQINLEASKNEDNGQNLHNLRLYCELDGFTK